MQLLMTGILNSWDKKICSSLIYNRKNAPICVRDKNDTESNII